MGLIGLVLGISTQAARDRFGDADETKGAPVADLMAALERSVAKAKEQKPRSTKRKPATKRTG